MVDVIDTCLSRFVLLVSTDAMNLMPLTNVNSCPEVHEVIDVVTVVGQRSKFLDQLRLDEWFDVVVRPRGAPEDEVILCDQSRLIVKPEPRCSLEVRTIQIRFLRQRPTVSLDRDCHRAVIEVAKAAERGDGWVYR